MAEVNRVRAAAMENEINIRFIDDPDETGFTRGPWPYRQLGRHSGPYRRGQAV
jgi:hypothetical protein